MSTASHRRSDLPSRLVEPIGEWTLGPRDLIEFDSRPLAGAGTTVGLKWGSLVLVVRVDGRLAGRARGRVLRTARVELCSG